MPLTHFALLVVLVSIWGFNFVVIKIGLEGISPVMLCFARFFLASIPFVFFVKRPKASFTKVVSYGLIMFALQFSLLFIGMKVGISPGLASLLLQVQVFFTIALAVFLFKEKLHITQVLGALIGISGIVLIWHHTRGEITMAGFMFVMGAAFFWSIGNAISKTIDKNEMIPLVIWASFIAWPPLLLLSLVLDGPTSVMSTISHFGIRSLGATAYIAYFSTLFGFLTWNYLLHKNTLATVAPFTLFVPIVAVISSSLYFHEPFPLWKLGAGFLVMSGLVINTFGPRFFPKKPIN